MIASIKLEKFDCICKREYLFNLRKIKFNVYMTTDGDETVSPHETLSAQSSQATNFLISESIRSTNLDDLTVLVHMEYVSQEGVGRATMNIFTNVIHITVIFFFFFILQVLPSEKNLILLC